MTTGRYTILACDGDGGECESFVPGGNAKEARREAAVMGWQLGGNGSDFCPECCRAADEQIAAFRRDSDA